MINQPNQVSPSEQTRREGILQPSSATDSDAIKNLTSDFETFIKMLTVQVENQDPLNPVDSTDYATQLATFSSVEQQVLTNDLLRSLNESLVGSDIQRASSWIGMEGLVRAPGIFADGGQISILPSFAEGTEEANLVIRGTDGSVIDRRAIPVDGKEIDWDGRDSDGRLQTPGIYRFEIESIAGGDIIDTSLAKIYSRIDEIRSENGELRIRLADGSEVSPEFIEGLRGNE